ncbi:hypothetical protein PCASD_00534 [Puccinia coronata f. sp. avenae]|uniref:Uncharacterized protein n=1 Tax=Puccinia coronata f. sp. avenae TaxID=200324 RepID=A0A2N5VNS5_9BASI|nr:hypothetical protein PCASD_00534 [Puccinia coronata f. sp. avenae]
MGTDYHLYIGALWSLEQAFTNFIQSLPALTGRTRQFERCSNSRVRPVVGQALSDRSTCRWVGQACPISSWDRSHRTSRDRSDKSVRPVGSCFGQTVPVRPPVEHGCSSTARTAVFDRLMPACGTPELREPPQQTETYSLGLKLSKLPGNPRTQLHSTYALAYFDHPPVPSRRHQLPEI